MKTWALIAVFLLSAGGARAASLDLSLARPSDELAIRFYAPMEPAPPSTSSDRSYALAPSFPDPHAFALAAPIETAVTWRRRLTPHATFTVEALHTAASRPVSLYDAIEPRHGQDLVQSALKLSF